MRLYWNAFGFFPLNFFRFSSLILFLSLAAIFHMVDSCEAPTAPNKWPLITIHKHPHPRPQKRKTQLRRSALLSKRKLDFRPDLEFGWLFSLAFLFSSPVVWDDCRWSHHCLSGMGMNEWKKQDDEKKREIGSFAWRHLTIYLKCLVDRWVWVFFSLSAEFFSDFREWDEAIKRYCVVYSNERHILFSFVSFDLLIQFNHRIQVKSTWRFIFYFFPQHLEKRNPHIVCHSIRKRRKFPLYAKYSSSALLNCDVSSERAITGWTEDNATDLCEASNDWLPFSLFSRQLGI